MSWYLSDLARLRDERVGLQTFALDAEWLTLFEPRLDDAMLLVFDADIAVGNQIFPVFLLYPAMFPATPPSVFPRGISARWSDHQFGAGGELCLEYGPDNWTPDMTGVHILESAYRLLSQEHPAEGEPAAVASRHQETLGQSLRHKYGRLLVTRRLKELVDTLSVGASASGDFILLYHDKSSTYIVETLILPGSETWKDDIPKPVIDEGRRLAVLVAKIAGDADWPVVTDAATFRAQVEALGLTSIEGLIVLARGPELQAYFVSSDAAYDVGVALPPPFRTRLDTSHEILKAKSVALVGCGSLGSKVGTTLARCGVGRFLLVDDDVLLPDNFVRNDLDWRDVGSHKVNALTSRILLVNPEADVAVWRAQLGGQQASSSAGAMLGRIAECDLILDATADPTALNLLSAIVEVKQKPLVWGEVFGGGYGGLIARCRPGKDPSPQFARRAIENWFAERGVKPVRSQRGYETGADGPPLIADDADVGAIAAHVARFAVDALMARDPSHFPYSAYVIGLAPSEGLFAEPFQTYPINLGRPPPGEPKPELSPDETSAEVQHLVRLFEARSDEAAASAQDSTAS